MTPIRIQAISDLHAGLALGRLPGAGECATDTDLVVIAGDVGHAPDAPMLARRMFPDATHLVLVASNREHYGTGTGTGMAVDGDMVALRAGAVGLSCKDARFHVLENEAAVVAVRDIHIRVPGSTLWTDYALFGAPDAGMAACARAMTDHRLIRDQDERAVRPEELRLRHAHSRRFLADARLCRSLGRDDGGRPAPPAVHAIRRGPLAGRPRQRGLRERARRPSRARSCVVGAWPHSRQRGWAGWWLRHALLVQPGGLRPKKRCAREHAVRPAADRGPGKDGQRLARRADASGPGRRP